MIIQAYIYPNAFKLCKRLCADGFTYSMLPHEELVELLLTMIEENEDLFVDLIIDKKIKKSIISILSSSKVETNISEIFESAIQMIGGVIEELFDEAQEEFQKDMLDEGCFGDLDNEEFAAFRRNLYKTRLSL